MTPELPYAIITGASVVLGVASWAVNRQSYRIMHETMRIWKSRALTAEDALSTIRFNRHIRAKHARRCQVQQQRAFMLGRVQETRKVLGL